MTPSLQADVLAKTLWDIIHDIPVSVDWHVQLFIRNTTMNKLLAALIATLFAVGAFAADAPAKKDDKAAAPAAAASPAKAEKKEEKKAEKKEEKKADKKEEKKADKKEEKKADKPADKASK